jgi:two-component system chemotaxis sensor kinase CheA
VLLDVDVLYGLQLDDLRAAIMRTRMVPVAELLARIPLLVRGLCRDTGRAVRLEIDAQDAELDKAVGDRIFPAIVHLVRNAIDHAIEPPDERERLGKPREGRIRIFCNTRTNNQLELVLSDDGRGIDAAAVARRAGRDVPQTPAALLELLATPGFSTLDQATKTSGRGLGMDIVRRIVTSDLRGELTLRTILGQGTSFTLQLPLTLTIVDVFLVQCGSEQFVVPVSAIEEIIEVDEAPQGKKAA